MTTALEQLFTYGQTRERYAMQEGETLRAIQEISSLVRQEHLPALKQALLQDQSVLTTRENNLWQLQLTPISRQCLWEMHSGIFLRLLENITGHRQLIPDAKCQFLALHIQKQNSLVLPHWHDNETGLPVVLYVLLGLDTGNAILSSMQEQQLSIKEPALQLAFMHFSGEIT